MTGRCLTKHAPIACDGFYLSALLTLWRGQNAPPLRVRAEEMQPLLFRRTRRCESQGAEKKEGVRKLQRTALHARKIARVARMDVKNYS